jgi:ABC-type sugar transport system ATPase subunit
MSEDAPAWEVTGLTKRFAGVTAVNAVTLRIRPAEIHGLVGENGSGKSTLIKMLSGANVFLGRLPKRRGQVDWKTLRESAARALAEIDAPIDVNAAVGSLSVAEQQLVEIAKALAADSSMIILDEPTTALGIAEIARLHALLKRLKASGRAILYISHRLDEVVELVDCVTILKDGRVASAAEQSKVDIPYIVRTMVGDVEEHYPKDRNATGEVLLRVRGLSTRNRVTDVSFEVHRGEVFGIGGVLGSRRTELARALFGVDPIVEGSIELNGKPVALKNSKQAVASRIALVPENRKSDGLFFNFAGFPNISIAALGRLGEHGLLSLSREREICRRFVRELEIAPAAETKEVGFLSGGNQQKVVIARWLFADADLFIFDEPTQGIDIGARIAVYRLINGLTAAGKGVILISSDDDELLSMSDRVAIMSHGRMVGIHRPDELDATSLVRASAGTAALKTAA